MSVYRMVGHEFLFARRRRGAEAVNLNKSIFELCTKIISKVKTGSVTSAPPRLRANQNLFLGQFK